MDNDQIITSFRFIKEKLLEEVGKKKEKLEYI